MSTPNPQVDEYVQGHAEHWLTSSVAKAIAVTFLMTLGHLISQFVTLWHKYRTTGTLDLDEGTLSIIVGEVFSLGAIISTVYAFLKRVHAPGAPLALTQKGVDAKNTVREAQSIIAAAEATPAVATRISTQDIEAIVQGVVAKQPTPDAIARTTVSRIADAQQRARERANPLAKTPPEHPV